MDAANPPFEAYRRFRADGEASAGFTGYGVAVSVHSVNGESMIVELDSWDEAIAFVAEANGETEADVLKMARMHAQHLYNLRTRKRAPATDTDGG